MNISPRFLFASSALTLAFLMACTPKSGDSGNGGPAPVKAQDGLTCYSADLLPPIPAGSTSLVGFWQAKGSNTSVSESMHNEFEIWAIGTDGQMLQISTNQDDLAKPESECMVGNDFLRLENPQATTTTATFSQATIDRARAQGASDSDVASALEKFHPTFTLQSNDELQMLWENDEPPSIYERVPAAKALAAIEQNRQRIADRAKAKREFLAKYQGHRFDLTRTVWTNYDASGTVISTNPTPAAQIPDHDDETINGQPVSWPRPKSLLFVNDFEVLVNQSVKATYRTVMDEKGRFGVEIEQQYETTSYRDLLEGFVSEIPGGIGILSESGTTTAGGQQEHSTYTYEFKLN